MVYFRPLASVAFGSTKLYVKLVGRACKRIKNSNDQNYTFKRVPVHDDFDDLVQCGLDFFKIITRRNQMSIRRRAGLV